jgi:ubiquinone/menaquinone biosynthesis C-methylase UbiE
MSQIVFDEKMVAQLEALYSTRDVLRRRRLVHEGLGARSGERIVDVGCGPGFYVEELAEQVGDEGSVVGVDPSAPMLEVAAGRTAARSNVAFHQGDAAALPLPDGGCDAALCVQVLEYVEDVTAALRELRRVVRPGGRVLVWDVDWRTVSWHSADPARMRRVLEAWDAHLTHPSLPRSLAPRMREAGLQEVRAEGHTFATVEGDPQSYGGANVAVIENYVAGHEDIGPDETAAWAGEQRELAERGEFYFACVQLCFTAMRPELGTQD